MGQANAVGPTSIEGSFLLVVTCTRTTKSDLVAVEQQASTLMQNIEF